MNELANTAPQRLALPVSYRSLVNTAPVLVNNGQKRRYTMKLPNGLFIMVDTFKDERIEFRAMPSSEARYIRMHNSLDVNDSSSYVCRVTSPQEFLRALLKFSQISPERVNGLNRNIGLHINSEEAEYLRPFLSTDPIYCGKMTTYVFEFPNGYTVIVKHNNNGTFDATLQRDDGLGMIEFNKVLPMFKHRQGMTRLVGMPNDMTINVLMQLSKLPEPEPEPTYWDIMTKRYWDELDETEEYLTKGTDFKGFISKEFDKNAKDLIQSDIKYLKGVI